MDFSQNLVEFFFIISLPVESRKADKVKTNLKKITFAGCSFSQEKDIGNGVSFLTESGALWDTGQLG